MTNPAPVPNKVAVFQRKTAEARQAEEAAKQEKLIALHDRNVLVCALLAQHRGAITIPQTALDQAAQMTGLLRYDRGTAVLGRERAPGFLERLIAAFRPSGAAGASLVPALGGGPVPVPVLILRWATQEEQAAQKAATEKAAHTAKAVEAAAESDRVREEGARIPNTEEPPTQ
jgi:hypothetical protein